MASVTQYANEFGMDLEKLLNGAIYATVQAGLRAAVNATKHDTSRAAYHWILVPGSGSGLKPGSRRLAKFDYGVRGTPPVGLRRRGQEGANAAAVRKWVVERETNEVLRRALATSRSKVGKGTTVFAFYNATPEENGEGDSAGQTPYAKAAHIEDAKATAMAVMDAVFKGQVERGKIRARYR